MFKISNLTTYLKWGGFALIIAVLVGFSVKKDPEPPPPPKQEPIIVEWEVDKEFGEKYTTLKNGITLVLSHDDKKKESKWTWSVSGETLTEKEAVQMAFKLGGVK